MLGIIPKHPGIVQMHCGYLCSRNKTISISSVNQSLFRELSKIASGNAEQISISFDVLLNVGRLGSAFKGCRSEQKQGLMNFWGVHSSRVLILGVHCTGTCLPFYIYGLSVMNYGFSTIVS